MSIDFNKPLTPNFRLIEFLTTSPMRGGHDRVCRDLEKLPKPQQDEIIKNLTQLAVLIQREVRPRFDNKPIIINSGWRGVQLNKEIGGASRSQHLFGRAADIVIVGVGFKQVQRTLDPIWPGGLGYGNGFTHLDIRPQRARFNY